MYSFSWFFLCVHPYYQSGESKAIYRTRGEEAKDLILGL